MKQWSERTKNPMQINGFDINRGFASGGMDGGQ